MSVPQKLHTFWFDHNDDNNFTAPECLTANVDSWITKNIDCRFKFWNRQIFLDSLDEECRSNRELAKYRDVYHQMNAFALQQFGRFVICYLEGGIVFDPEFYCVSSLPDFDKMERIQIPLDTQNKGESF